MNVVAKLSKERHRRRPRRLKSLAVVPTLFTLANLICGFAAIYFGMRAILDPAGDTVPFPATEADARAMSQLLERMLPSFLSFAGGLIFLGMLFDAFDGLVARVTRSTTEFGGQLDSLADVVTFGVAPAIVMISFLIVERHNAAILPSPISEHLVDRVAWVSAAVFVACAAIRLARYNVEHDKADFDYRLFRGLPSPGAAGLLAAMIIFQDGEQVGVLGRAVIAYCMPAVALASGFLMVSRVPYKRFYRMWLVGKQPFSRIVVMIAVLAAFWTYKAPTLLAVMSVYALSGPVGWVIRVARRSGHGSHVEATAGEADEPRRTG